VTGSLERLVGQIEDTRRDLEQALAEPDLVADRARFAEVNRRWSALQPAVALADELRRCQSDVTEAEALLAEGDDPDLREMLAQARERIEAIEPELREAMVEPDPHDERDVIVEIRAAAGGEEAALFARDLLDIYTRYAAHLGFRTELMESSPAEAGGFRQVSLEIKGAGAYSVFKHEGGVHRVQRVPVTESQGRIHTSTATVAVMPEVDDVEVTIDPNDVKVDVYRSTGPGGQSVNTTDSAVRVTHVPTGIVVAIQDEKSQLQNREKAMRVLRARLYERALEEQQAEVTATRRSQLGSGDRAEKVRTYNFPQNRVTDHRVNVTVPLKEQVMQGQLDRLTDALQAEERRVRLADLAESLA